MAGLITLGVTTGLLPVGITGTSPAYAVDADYGELLVVLDGRPPSAPLIRTHRRLDGEVTRRVSGLDLYVVKVRDPERAAHQYAASPGVRYVEPNATVSVAGEPDDPLYGHQWHLRPTSGSNQGTANVQGAWSRTKGRGVVVAVVDTGVKKGGSDLWAGRVLAGRDFVNDDDDPADDHGHGTHVAGTVAQSTDNGRGVAGVAPKAKVLPVKVLNAAGAGTYADVIEGILWAKDRADVINLSLAGTTYSQALCDAVTQAAAQALVVAAAGNGGGLPVGYPAACDDALAVGSVRQDGRRPSYGNYGPALDLVAPGGDLGVDQDGDGYGDGILQQTYDGGWSYTFYEGTSMAAAHVSGVAALVLSAKPDADVRAVLLETARDLGPPGRDDEYGAGAVDAKAAVSKVTATAQAATTRVRGYHLVTDRGAVYTFGKVPHKGSAAGFSHAPVVDAMASPSGKGYALVTETGAVFAFGDFTYRGRLRGHRVVAAMAHPSGRGYYLVTAAGGVKRFGRVPRYGSAAGFSHAPVVDAMASPSGKGYALVTETGAVFAFGDFTYRGRLRGHRVVTAMAHPSGRGYYLVTAAGGVKRFGRVPRYGSATRFSHPGIVDATVTPSGKGYYLVSRKGGVYTFGDAAFRGSTAGVARVGSVVSAVVPNRG